MSNSETASQENITFSELENKVKDIKSNYNKHLTTLYNVQLELSIKESDCHRTLRKLHTTKPSGEEEKKYTDLYNGQYNLMEEVQLECNKSQSACFSLLQSLYQHEMEYLVSYIKVLQGQKKELADKVAEQSTQLEEQVNTINTLKTDISKLEEDVRITEVPNQNKNVANFGQQTPVAGFGSSSFGQSQAFGSGFGQSQKKPSLATQNRPSAVRTNNLQ